MPCEKLDDTPASIPMMWSPRRLPASFGQSAQVAAQTASFGRTCEWQCATRPCRCRVDQPRVRFPPTSSAGATPTFSATFDEDEMYLASVVDDSLGLLPDRWMQVLWATEVEGRKPRDIGREMHMSANSVAALTKRARQGFRSEFAKQLNERSDELHRLADVHRDAYDAGTLSPMTAALLNAHIDSCGLCSDQPMAVSRVVAWPVALWLGATTSSGVAAVVGGGAATAAVAGGAARRALRAGAATSGAANGTLVAAAAAALVAVSVGVVAAVASDGGTESAAQAAPTSVTEVMKPRLPDEVAAEGAANEPLEFVNAIPDGEFSDSFVIDEFAASPTTSTTVSVAPPPATDAPAPPIVVSRPAAEASSRSLVPTPMLVAPVPATEPTTTATPATTSPDTTTTVPATTSPDTTTTAPATTSPDTTTTSAGDHHDSCESDRHVPGQRFVRRSDRSGGDFAAHHFERSAAGDDPHHLQPAAHVRLELLDRWRRLGCKRYQLAYGATARHHLVGRSSLR